MVRKGTPDAEVVARHLVTLRVPVPFEDFDERNQRLFVYSLSGFLGEPPDSIEIIEVERGSTIVTIELSVEGASKLLQALREHKPDLSLILQGRVPHRDAHTQREPESLGESKVTSYSEVEPDEVTPTPNNKRTGATVLITGGAGFIGSHLADELLQRGYRVRVLDSLLPQVHGPTNRPPTYLATEVEFIKGDVRDGDAVRRALDGVHAVFHLAAAVGVGQSMYEMEHYTSTNALGTAVLLEALIERPVERLIVASSMSIYGEGLYRDEQGNLAHQARRSLKQLREGRWELVNERGQPLEPIPTDERKRPDLWSIYALGKYDQEQMALMVGRTYGFGVVALRFFDVFGPRQALSNPYTGVLAIFASRLLNGKPPLIFEDGLQRRDFVSVHDAARAARLALEEPTAAGHVLNVGSGCSYTIREVAQKMGQVLGRSMEPIITSKYRTGDVRHCFADITQARRLLGYAPQTYLEDGLTELADWLTGQIAVDRVEQATLELERRGLTL